jgi:EpsI family protein
VNVNSFLRNRPAAEWLILLAPTAMLAGLLLSCYYTVAVVGLWANEEYAYAPLLAGIAFLLFLYRGRQMLRTIGGGEPVWGTVLLSIGLAGYVFGHSQRIELVELFSTIPVIAGFITTIGGRDALKIMRFPLLFLFFTIPYPSWILYLLTSPLKTAISAWTETLLYNAGYPVARSGVILAVGSYRMLVADACSGMHSLIFLVALGLLYLHLTGPRQPWHRTLLVLALVPIAVVANFVRVVILVLTTYHFGAAAGQSYWHSLAGLLLFVLAFLSLFVLDGLLTQFNRPAAHQAGGSPGRQADHGEQCKRRMISPTASIVLTLIFLVAGTGAEIMKPKTLLADIREDFDLERILPRQFGGWRQNNQGGIPQVPQEIATDLPRQYNQALNRTYVNEFGYGIMLSISYGRSQLGSELQAHRPESCYRAQGFVLLDSSTAALALDGQVLNVRRLVTRQNTRIEPVSYWMTIGDTATLPGIPRKLEQLGYSLRGLIPDGMLVRVSSLDGDFDRAFQAHYRFIEDLQQVVPRNFGLGADVRLEK